MGKLISTLIVALLFCLALAVQAAAAPGELDTGFGSGGDVRLAPPPSTTGWNPLDVAAAPDGKTVVVATAQECPFGPGACRRHLYVGRYMQNGSLDSSYGVGGFAIVDDPRWEGGAVTSTADSQGRVVVASADMTGVTLTRLDSAGRPDVTWGPGGTSTVACTCSYETLMLFVDSEGRVLVGGRLTYPAIKLTRLLAGGVIDQTYGVDGAASAELDARQGVMRQNGSIVLSVFGRGQGSSLARISANGRGVNSAFNASKRLRGRQIQSLATLPGNRLAVLGTQSRGTQSYVMLIGGNGGIVQKFARRGVALANFAVSGIAGDSNGRILLAGVQAERGTGGPKEGPGVLRRRLVNGKPDQKFVNGLAAIKGSTEIALEPFFSGNRPMVFQWSSFVPECRSYCPPDPHLFRFMG